MNRWLQKTALVLLGAAVLAVPATRAFELATKPASTTGRLAVVDAIVERAILDKQIPGAVVLIGHNGQVAYRKAFGRRALEPRRESMTVDTIFDLASLTKVIATTTSVMQLVEHGKIRLNDTVAKYLPEFGQNGKEDITVRQLLTHYSGLAPDLDLTTPWQGKRDGLQDGVRREARNATGLGIRLQRH